MEIISTKITDFALNCLNNIDHSHERPTCVNKLTIDEQYTYFYNKYGFHYPYNNINRLILYNKASFPLALCLSVEDNNEQLLIASLMLENNFPIKAPYQLYHVHCCIKRSISIGEALDLAQDKPIMNILEYRMSKCILLFPCCNRDDDRIQLTT